jgi:SOS-response transcriptional repressor LexA
VRTLSPITAQPTERQQAFFLWLWEYTCEHGYQPSYREMSDFLGCTSPNNVRNYLVSLARRSRSIDFLLCPDGTPFRGFQNRPEPAVSA